MAAALKLRVADAAADYAEGEESEDDVPLALVGAGGCWWLLSVCSQAELDWGGNALAARWLGRMLACCSAE